MRSLREDPVSALCVGAWFLALVACLVAMLTAPAFGASLGFVQGGASPGKEVKLRSILVLALCAGCAVDQSGSSGLLPASDAAIGSRGQGRVPAEDAGVTPVDSAGGDMALAPADVGAVPDAVAPGDLGAPGLDAPAWPACSAVGFDPQSFEGCRPGDPRYLCGVCQGLKAAPACVQDDRRTLCVTSCSLCPFADGGAP